MTKNVIEGEKTRASQASRQPFFPSVHIRGTGARRTTLSKSEQSLQAGDWLRLTQSRVPCAYPSYVDGGRCK